MDRHRAFAALLIALVAVAADAPLPLREAQWTIPAMRLEALAMRPRECVALPSGSAALASFLIGRAAFNTPTLLGGQAARAGLSCASCHINGRGNPHFTFPGLSSAPGTADVTSSIMSKVRGDGMHNPKPIPDLARDAPKISRAAGDPALAAFMRGLVVEEFDGPEPPSRVLEGLATYVRAQSPALCADDKAVRPTLQQALADASDASEAAIRLALDEDRPAMRLMIGAARAALGRIDERLVGSELIKARKRIARLDAALLKLQRSEASAKTASRLQVWQLSLARDGSAVRVQEQATLYNPEKLAAALQR